MIYIAVDESSRNLLDSFKKSKNQTQLNLDISLNFTDLYVSFEYENNIITNYNHYYIKIFILKKLFNFFKNEILFLDWDTYWRKEPDDNFLNLIRGSNKPFQMPIYMRRSHHTWNFKKRAYVHPITNGDPRCIPNASFIYCNDIKKLQEWDEISHEFPWAYEEYNLAELLERQIGQRDPDKFMEILEPEPIFLKGGYANPRKLKNIDNIYLCHHKYF